MGGEVMREKTRQRMKQWARAQERNIPPSPSPLHRHVTATFERERNGGKRHGGVWERERERMPQWANKRERDVRKSERESGRYQSRYAYVIYLCVRVCVCVCVCMYLCMFVCMHVYIHTCIYSFCMYVNATGMYQYAATLMMITTPPTCTWMRHDTHLNDSCYAYRSGCFFHTHEHILAIHTWRHEQS